MPATMPHEVQVQAMGAALRPLFCRLPASLLLVSLFLASLLLAAACGGAPDGVSGEVGEATLDLTLPGRDVQMRWDPSGDLHLAYVEDVPGDGSPRVRYARWDSGSAAPVWVSPPELDVSAHGEVPPTLERLPDGTLVIAYTVSLPGKWKGEIRLQRSTDGGRTWTESRLLHDDEGAGSHSFLASVVTAEGRAAFAWLDNRDGQQGLRTATTADGAEISANTTVDAVTCQCCATELLTAADGTVYLAYRDLVEPEDAGEGEPAGTRDIRITLSRDGGASYEESRPVSEDGWQVAACPHTGPRLAEERPRKADAALWATWFTGAEPGIWVAKSTDGGQSFGPRTAMARMGGEVRLVAHPEIAVLPDGRRVVLWEEGRQVAGETTHRLRARLADPGSDTWGPPVTVASGGVFPRVAVAEDGRTALAFTRLGGRSGESSEIHGGTAEIAVVDLEAALAGGLGSAGRAPG